MLAVRALKDLPSRLRRARLLALALAVALSSLISPPKGSFAREADEEIDAAMGGLGWSLRKSTVEAMADVLKLQADQRKSVLDLYATYNAQVKDAARKVMDFQRGMGADVSGMPSKEDMKKMMEAFQNFSDHAENLESKFLEDFKTTLTAQQVEAWPRAERRKRLSDASASGPLGGGTVDLVGIARSVVPDGKLPDDAAAIFDQYEQDMDAAITPYLEWRENLEKSLKDLGEQLGGKSMQEQQEFGRKMMLEGIEKSKPALDVNNRALAKIAAALPESARDRFQLNYYRSAYFQFNDQAGPQLDRAFDTAATSDALTEEQKKAVAEIRRAHDADTLALYRSLAEAREKEMAGASGPEGLWGGQSMTDFYTKSPQMIKAAVDKVRAALPADVLARLPEPFKPVEIKEPTFEE